MKNNLGTAVAILASLVGALLMPPGACRGEEPSHPGRLTRVLVDLRNNGKARTEQGLAWLLEREAVAHLMFMATDSRGGTGGGGWYRPSQSRYDWEWIRRRLDKDGDGAVSLAEFSGPREWFEALDKNRDGLLTADDFDWFGDSDLAKASTKIRPLFSQIDQDGNGQITPAEWKLWFDSLSGAKGYIGQDDLLPLFIDKRMSRTRGATKPPSLGNRLSVLCSYISGDVGSLSEGPALDGKAPYFTLATMNGKEKLDLSWHRGKKPLVLIFGSFT
jgi:hypothetical protein